MSVKIPRDRLTICRWIGSHFHDCMGLHFQLFQEPITRSLYTNCTLKSTLSRISLSLKLRYVGGSSISRENTPTFRAFRHY